MCLTVFSLLSPPPPPPPGGLIFSGPFEVSLLEREVYLRGERLIYFLVKLYDNFLPAQRNVCRAMYSNNFNTALNVS